MYSKVLLASLAAQAARAALSDIVPEDNKVADVIDSANTVTDLLPVRNPERKDTLPEDAVKPQNLLCLTYGTQEGAADNSLVKVDVGLPDGAVLLEELGDAAAVACDDSSVSVTFKDAAHFAEAKAGWVAPFVLFTNHQGGCDVDNERGIFKASSVTLDEAGLKIVATTEKTDIKTVASDTTITFSNLPVARAKRAPLARAHPRDLSIADDGAWVITDGVSVADHEIYASDDGAVTLTADSASVDSEVTLSASIKLSGLVLSECTFDIDWKASAAVEITAAVEGTWSETQSYAVDGLRYDLVNVPGIIVVGPAVLFEIGVDLSASASVEVTVEAGVGFPDANVHLDLLDSGKTTATGWEPESSASVTMAEQARFEIAPFVEVGVELVVELLGGLVDLSSGIGATAKLPSSVTLDAAQEADTEDGADGTASETEVCPDGVNLASDLVFSVDAWATQWYETNLYEVTVPLVSKCYTWA